MKKFLTLALVATTLSGCHYLGTPEAYTVVEETPAAQPVQPVVAPQPVVQAPVMPAPVMQAPVAPACGGCAYGQTACQINPGVRGPIMITIPASTVCVQ